jgi:hypothetical protein
MNACIVLKGTFSQNRTGTTMINLEKRGVLLDFENLSWYTAERLPFVNNIKIFNLNP